MNASDLIQELARFHPTDRVAVLVSGKYYELEKPKEVQSEVGHRFQYGGEHGPEIPATLNRPSLIVCELGQEWIK